jgi:hypothetical protein
MNPSGSSIVTCRTCGVIWELEPQELSPEKFECAECGTTFKTTGNEGENRAESSSEKPKTIPLIQHSIGFVVVFFAVLYVSGVIGQAIVFGKGTSPYDTGPVYIGILHYAVMIPMTIGTYVTSAIVCPRRISGCNVFAVAAIACGSSLFLGVIVDLCLKILAGR